MSITTNNLNIVRSFLGLSSLIAIPSAGSIFFNVLDFKSTYNLPSSPNIDLLCELYALEVFSVGMISLFLALKFNKTVFNFIIFPFLLIDLGSGIICLNAFFNNLINFQSALLITSTYFFFSITWIISFFLVNIDIQSKMYDFFMKPVELKGLSQWREETIKICAGDILEVGPGTGINLQFYDYHKVHTLDFVEPSNCFLRTLKKKTQVFESVNFSFNQEFFESFETNKRYDFIVFTLSLCSVNDLDKTLKKSKSLLKEDGKIIFIEHVKSTNPFISFFQSGLTPIWKKFNHNCHLNRNVKEAFVNNGFNFDYLRSDKIKGEFILINDGLIGIATKGECYEF